MELWTLKKNISSPSFRKWGVTYLQVFHEHVKANKTYFLFVVYFTANTSLTYTTYTQVLSNCCIEFNLIFLRFMAWIISLMSSVFQWELKGHFISSHTAALSLSPFSPIHLWRLCNCMIKLIYMSMFPQWIISPANIFRIKQGSIFNNRKKRWKTAYLFLKTTVLISNVLLLG